MKKKRKVFRVVLLLLAVVLLTPLVLLESNSFQTRLAGSVLDAVTENLPGHFHIDSLAISPSRMCVEVYGISATDSLSQPILNVRRVDGSIRLVKFLLHNQIAVNNIHLTGFDLHLVKDSLHAPLNISYLFNNSSEEEKEKKPLNLNVDLKSLMILDGHVSYDVLSEPYLVTTDPNHLSVRLNTQMALKFSIASKLDSVDGQILRDIHAGIRMNKFSLKEQNGFEIDRIRLQATMDNDSISFRGMEMEMPGSNLKLNAFSFKGPFKEAVFLNTATLQAELFPSDFPTVHQAFEAASLRNQPLKVLASINGSTEKLNVSVGLNSGNLIGIEGWCQASDVMSKDRKVTSRWKHLGADAMVTDLLEQLLHGFNTPSIIKTVGYASYAGEANLTDGQPSLNGVLSTGLGDIALKARLQTVDSLLKLETDISTADLAVEKLGLDFLTGPATFQASVQGYIPHKNVPLNAKATVSIGHASLLDYDYQDITVDASVNGKRYEAQVEAADANCRFLLDAFYDQRGKKPEARVSLEVPHINLHELHLLESNNGLSDLTFDMNGHVSGSTLNEMLTALQLEIEHFSLANNGAQYKMNRLTIVSGKHNGNQYLQLTSPLINGRIIGTGTFLDMVEDVCDGLINRYVPALYIGKTWKPSDDLYQFAFHIQGVQQLSKALGLPATIDGIADIEGSYNNENGAFSLEVESSDVSFSGQRLLLPTLNIANTDTSHLDIKARSGLLKSGNRADASLDILIRQDSIELSALWNDFGISDKGSLCAATGLHRETAKQPLEIWATLYSPSFLLGNDEWMMHPSVFHIQPEHFDLQHVSLMSGSKFLRVDGAVSKSIEDTLNFDVNGFRIDDIFAMLPAKEEKDPFTIGGVATAKGKAVALLGAPRIEGLLSVDGFCIKKRLLGDLQAASWWDEKDKCIRLDGTFADDSLEICQVLGSFAPATSNLGLKVKANGLPIDFVSTFLEPALTLKGPVYGDVDVNIGLGRYPTEILLEGSPRFNGEVGVTPIGGKFLIDDTIELHHRQICFNQVKLSDHAGHSGELNGDIEHHDFKDIKFNMDIGLNSLKVMDLPASDNETMYGDVLASGKVLIRGSDKDIRINVNARTENPSTFTFSLGGTSATDYEFIHFVDHSVEDILSVEDEATTFSPGGSLKLNLQLDVTDDTEVNLKLGQNMGDGLKGRGNGEIRIEFDTSGDVGIYGDYELHSGLFQFQFKNIIQRNFTIEQGSNIRFAGDPLKAQMGVTATYHVIGASLSGILSESDMSALNLTRSTIPVDCMLNLSGELQQPQIYMDMAFPNADSEVERRIRSVINTDEAISRQLIYLLLLNTFAPTENSQTGNTASSNMNAVWGATLNGLTSQLNQVLFDALGTDNFSLGFNYNSDINTGSNEWQVALTGNLLDNRLKINGNVGQRDDIVTNTTGQFIGDFDLEYKLTQRLRLKAYSHSNDSRYFKSASTTQGLGIVVKDSFSTLSQLWNNWVESFHRQKIRSFSYSDLLPKDTTTVAK